MHYEYQERETEAERNTQRPAENKIPSWVFMGNTEELIERIFREKNWFEMRRKEVVSHLLQACSKDNAELRHREVVTRGVRRLTCLKKPR